MAIRTRTLEETQLWKTYSAKIPPQSDRGRWVHAVFNDATNYLKDVRRTFENYTLHDQTHILNVIDAMGGLLGDQVNSLSIGELELLILSASMHDLGMVYTDEEIERHYNDALECRTFLQKYSPELLGCPASEWPEDTRQFFLRQLHPFRLHEILHAPNWRDLFDQRPLEIVPERCIVAVCQAHGEEGRNLKNIPDLEYLEASAVDPLFCALLLRISDLLDFDDTRAPKILYDYVAKSKKSQEEWDKHRASAGFTYRTSPSNDPLPYKANCYNPGIEHAVREFLNWVDEELDICTEQKRRCWQDWQRKFPFPRAVSRKEIESNGYLSGDFKMTMDQEQILSILSGENLYNNNVVFVRELLQNSIDATMLRAKIDRNFNMENARVDLWEWSDQEGYIWFRIDDRGTGMTQGMLQRYFLKVGNSYYTSKELTRDLHMHGLDSTYQGISRFGIGFLSCFLCGEYAEVSTLYFDSEKNRQESGSSESLTPAQYGLRMEVTGLSGYYTLKSQEKHHIIDAPLATPPYAEAGTLSELENAGYRSIPGTSVVVRLNPRKLGPVDLCKQAENYLCVCRFPVYYNGKRIGKTYQEFMEDVHKLAGKNLYDFPDKVKTEFDAHFPDIAGQYPKITMTVAPVDEPERNILSGLSGVIINYDLQFEKPLYWQFKDQFFELRYNFLSIGENLSFNLSPHNINSLSYTSWPSLKEDYEFQALDELDHAFKNLSACPQNVEQVGEAWIPFEKRDLTEIWKIWVDHCQMELKINLNECGIPCLKNFSGNSKCSGITYAYNGVLHGNFPSGYVHNGDALFLLEDDLRPQVNISRSNVVAMPIKEIIAEAALLYSCGLRNKDHFGMMHGWADEPLSVWRELRTSELALKVNHLSEEFFSETMRKLREGETLTGREHYFSISKKGAFITCRDVLSAYFVAFLQDFYSMTIHYDDTNLQIVSFSLKESAPQIDDRYDLFPPMLFCKAADDESRRYLCCADAYFRRAITANHPYAAWLLDHVIILNQCFPRHFQQIIHCLCNEHARDIIDKLSTIHMQLNLLAQRQEIDIGQIPTLSAADFWEADWMKRLF